MKIVEILLDKFIASRLFEMARSRKDAKDIVTDLSPQIFTHLIKLYVFNSPENRDHWLKELNAWFNKIDDIHLKPSNQKPDWRTIYDWMIYDSSPHYDADFINGRVRKLKNTDYADTAIYDYDASTVLNEIFGVIQRVCRDLAKSNKFIKIEDYLDYPKN
jgi:hypothetical protein